MSDTPLYLVMDSAGVLHGYWRRDVLRVDLAMNKTDPPKTIFKLARGRLTVRYKKLIGRV